MNWRDEKTLSGETVYTLRNEGALIPICLLQCIGNRKWVLRHASGGTAIKGNFEEAQREAEEILGIQHPQG